MLNAGEIRRAELLRIVEGVFEAQAYDSVAGMPGGYVFKNPKIPKKELPYKDETERVLETIPMLDKPMVKGFEKAILSACKADDVEFFKRLGRVLSRKPVGLLKSLARKISEWNRKRIRHVIRFLIQYWIKPIGIIPGLCFLGPDDPVAVCNSHLGAVEDEGGMTLANVTKIAQRLGLKSAREKIPVIMVEKKMKIDPLRHLRRAKPNRSAQRGGAKQIYRTGKNHTIPLNRRLDITTLSHRSF